MASQGAVAGNSSSRWSPPCVLLISLATNLLRYTRLLKSDLLMSIRLAEMGALPVSFQHSDKSVTPYTFSLSISSSSSWRAFFAFLLVQLLADYVVKELDAVVLIRVLFHVRRLLASKFRDAELRGVLRTPWEILLIAVIRIRPPYLVFPHLGVEMELLQVPNIRLLDVFPIHILIAVVDLEPDPNRV